MIKTALLSVLSLSFHMGVSQKNGEWFARKGRGVTVFSFSNTQILAEDKRDSMDAVSTKATDTVEIVDKIKRGEFVYYVVRKKKYGFTAYLSMKIRMVNENSFVYYMPVNFNKNKSIDPDTSADAVVQHIESDTLPCLTINYFSRDSLIKAKSLPHCTSASEKEFISVLDDLVKSKDLVKDFVNMYLQGDYSIIFWSFSLIQADIETTSLLKNKFSPFITRADFEFLTTKYGHISEVHERLEKFKR